MSYELIETVELASSASSIEFTGIPQDGSDLAVKLSFRSTGTNQDILAIDTNGFSAIDTRRVLMVQDGTVSTTTDFRVWVPGSSFTANTFANIEIYYSNYTSSVGKAVSIQGVSPNNSASDFGASIVAVFDDKSGSAGDPDPVTSLEVYVFGGNLAQYSSASLYKITAA